MKYSEAIEILEKHNHWRRSGNGEMVNPTELGLAIDCIIEESKKKVIVYWRREIGEGDWNECTKEQYEYAKKSPLLDAKITHPQLSDEIVKDAAIGKLVREKMVSGNDVPVSRCVITRDEFDEAMKADNVPQ